MPDCGDASPFQAYCQEYALLVHVRYALPRTDGFGYRFADGQELAR